MDLQQQCKPLSDVLQQARAQSGLTHDKIAAAVGSTSDNVRNLMCGKVAAQNFFFVGSLFKFFHLSVDRYLDIDAPDSPAAEKPPEVLTSERFLEALAQQEVSHAREIEIYKERLAAADVQRAADRLAVLESDRRHSHREMRQFIVIIILLLFILAAILYDLFNPQSGFIRVFLKGFYNTSVRRFFA